MPSDSAASFMPREICASAACVLRTIGSSAYSASAMNAGTMPMRPVSGISTASSASEGMVCTTPVAPRIQSLRRGSPGGHDAERDADDDARGQRQEHEPEMLERQAPEVGTEELLPEAAGRSPAHAPVQQALRCRRLHVAR